MGQPRVPIIASKARQPKQRSGVAGEARRAARQALAAVATMPVVAAGAARMAHDSLDRHGECIIQRVHLRQAAMMHQQVVRRDRVLEHMAHPLQAVQHAHALLAIVAPCKR